MPSEINWYDPQKQLPHDGEECLIMPHSRGGLITAGVFGPIRWKANMNGTGLWLDIFRDPEAGTMISPMDVGCWTLWDPIAPPEGLPTPREL
jgi:hypothetical protein